MKPKNIFPYIFIASIVTFVWHKILNQAFLGEGYQYFNPVFNFFNGGSLSNLWKCDNFAKIMFDIFPPFFHDNIQAYLIIELFVAIVFSLLFYFVLFSITKSKIISFAATVFLSTNYVALFEFLGDGNYQRFAQRLPNLIPVIISFYFLWKFYNSKKHIYLFLSLILYAISVFMAHFSTFLLPIFIFFIFFQMFENKITFKGFLRRIPIWLLFIFISLYLTKNSEQQPPYNAIEFFSQEKNIIERVVLQIPIITIPLGLMNYFVGIISPLEHIQNPILKLFLIPSIIIYIGGGLLVFKRLPKLKTLYLTCFFSMLAAISFYIYTEPRFNIQSPPFTEERYYLPAIVFATVLWAAILKAIFMKKKITGTAIIFAILSLSIWYNTTLIWKHIDSIQYQSNMYKRFIAYIKNNPNTFNQDSIIVVPSYLSWPAPMITELIVPGLKFFLPSDEGWEKKLWTNKENVFVFDYDYEKGQIVDFTKDFRKGNKIDFLN